MDARPDAHDVLATEPYIRYGHGVWGGRLVENYLNRVGIRPRERFVLSTLDAIAVMVDRGLGVSLVPDWSRLGRKGCLWPGWPFRCRPSRGESACSG